MKLYFDLLILVRIRLSFSHWHISHYIALIFHSFHSPLPFRPYFEISIAMPLLCKVSKCLFRTLSEISLLFPQVARRASCHWSREKLIYFTWFQEFYWLFSPLFLALLVLGASIIFDMLDAFHHWQESWRPQRHYYQMPLKASTLAAACCRFGLRVADGRFRLVTADWEYTHEYDAGPYT